jgi:dTDP-4-amino-4,6-dideoxygalactose transaminase
MIPFSPPRIDQLIIDEVVDTLKSGWITTSPKTKQFEKNLTAYYNSKSTLCLNSATAGLELMLQVLDVESYYEQLFGNLSVLQKYLRYSYILRMNEFY